MYNSEESPNLQGFYIQNLGEIGIIDDEESSRGKQQADVNTSSSVEPRKEQKVLQQPILNEQQIKNVSLEQDKKHDKKESLLEDNEVNLLEDFVTQTYRLTNSSEQTKLQFIQMRKTTSQQDFENNLENLRKEGEYSLLIYFLIESEIYNNQTQLFVVLQDLFQLKESKGETIYKDIFCQKEVIKYVKKCKNLEKLADILYFTFQNKNHYDQTFYQDICKDIQMKITQNQDQISDFFHTNFFRIMIYSKRYNKNQGIYQFPQKSKIEASHYISKVLMIIVYVIACPQCQALKWLDLSHIEVVKVVIDYIFILKAEDIFEVHYIKFLFELIKPALDNMSIHNKYDILRYVLECLFITYHEKDPVKYPYSSSILLCYFENYFLNQNENEPTEEFDIDSAVNVEELNEYEILNIVENLLNTCQTEFSFLIIQQLAERLFKSDKPNKTCLKSIYKNTILKKVIFYIKKDGSITQLCKLISTFFYIFQGGDEEDFEYIFQILKYNKFIFHPYSELDKAYRQERINDFCKVIKQIIFHLKFNESQNQNLIYKKIETQQQIEIKKKNEPKKLSFQNAYASVEKQTKEVLTEAEFTSKQTPFQNKINIKAIELNKSCKGMTNYLNTCYFNSLMQALMRLDIFQTFFLQNNQHIQTQFFKNSRQLINHITSDKDQLNYSQLQQIVKDIIKCVAPNFQWGQQNDPSEFMEKYVSQMFYDVKGITDERMQNRATIIIDLFNIEKFQRKTCFSCKKFTNYIKERVNIIQLYLMKAKSLDFFDLIKSIQIGNVELHCQQCNKQVEMDNDVLFSKIPPLLVFQILRTETQGKKDIRKVNFPEFFNFLEIQNCGINFPFQKSNYRLMSVVNHIGQRNDFGHYISYSRYKQTNQWIKYNDQEVIICEQSQSIHEIIDNDADQTSFSTPYILIYQNLQEKEPVSIEVQIETYINRFKDLDKYAQD